MDGMFDKFWILLYFFFFFDVKQRVSVVFDIPVLKFFIFLLITNILLQKKNWSYNYSQHINSSNIFKTNTQYIFKNFIINDLVSAVSWIWQIGKHLMFNNTHTHFSFFFFLISLSLSFSTNLCFKLECRTKTICSLLVQNEPIIRGLIVWITENWNLGYHADI